MTPLIPAKDKLRLCFAHAAFDMKPIFDGFGRGIATVQVFNRDDLLACLPEVDVLVISALWKNDLLPVAGRLKYLQSISSGMNQYDLAAFRDRGIYVSSGQGVNRNAVSEHAFGLILSLTRRLALARDNQHKAFWRPDQTDPMQREDELPGKTLLIVGLGTIGDRIARLAKAFDMKVIGVRRDPAHGAGAADEVHSFHDLKALIPRADVVVLSCPLTEETRNLMDAEAIGLLKPTAFFVNVARGGCVEEEALIAALKAGRFAGAGIDVTAVEPLPADSPLWSMPNVVLTPHAAGETRKYERNVLEILTRNLDRLWAGDDALVNRVA
ncbi:D-2-hydroxyacid dehydrogenase [Paenirhodobacter populi]|uniref:D-2-hydroxyacid dehydrogenase n=1 Tax=Paenirhodobacter populi TaxID=2306993 RepID=A0A443IQU9_9RHOB|nr:D-2-hydroxyacid dehydrogenase [Sinirhodobacter populi]RWR08547.1 D-2-hydroxyacid dehydrogenase [Sinirhodobacter populi]